MSSLTCHCDPSLQLVYQDDRSERKKQEQKKVESDAMRCAEMGRLMHLKCAVFCPLVSLSASFSTMRTRPCQRRRTWLLRAVSLLGSFMPRHALDPIYAHLRSSGVFRSLCLPAQSGSLAWHPDHVRISVLSNTWIALQSSRGSNHGESKQLNRGQRAKPVVFVITLCLASTCLANQSF